MFHGYTAPHIANILLHILGSLLALGAGFTALVASKGGRLHTRAGRVFLYGYVVVLFTAVLGVAIFGFRSFLAVATLAAGYDVFAGYRALQLRGRRPGAGDTAVSLLGLLAPALFIGLMRWLRQPWSPALTWSVLGGLSALCAYDLLRHVFPLSYLRRTWVQEHLYKMMAALIALVSTAAATLLPRHMPWAALWPVIAGELVTVTYLIRGPRAWHRSSGAPGRRAMMNQTPQTALEDGT